MPASLHACGAVFPFAICTSICRSTVTICSALYFRIDISNFLLREILSHFRWYKKARSGHSAAAQGVQYGRKEPFGPASTARMPRFGARCYLTLSNEIQNHWLICIPPFPRKQSLPFRSARSGPGREAAKRTLDGEDRSGIVRREGKGVLSHWRNRHFIGPCPFFQRSLRGAVPSLPAGINEDESDPHGAG